MASVINLPRIAVKNWKEPMNPDKCIWIAVGEPGNSYMTYEAIRNIYLDELANLHINFWDLTIPVPAIGGTSDGAMIYPPSKEDAEIIVDFILAHKEKHVLVNCQAGVSRSGAIAQFCHDMLGYKWMDMGKRAAVPNTHLYKLMKDYYLSFNPEPIKAIDRRTRVTELTKEEDIF